MRKFAQTTCTLFCLGALTSVSAAPVFFDDFNAGASILWNNEVGSWSATGGVYDSLSPSTRPNALSSLPFELTDFSVELDINNVSDGGIWLRSASAATGIGRTGVLLVTGGNTRTGTGLYWHVVTGDSYGSNLNTVSGIFANGVSDPHLRVEAHGNTYSAYVNGSTVAATTLTNSAFSSGRVALYDFSGQTFDNVSITSAAIPEPSHISLLALAFLGLFLSKFGRRLKGGGIGA